MAIGPKEAEDLSPAPENIVRRLECRIDAWMLDHWAPGTQVYPLPWNVPLITLEFEKMLSRYRDCGWSVVEVKFQRGTRFICFTR
ncbi:MAG TPA: hypothetical protein VMJ72_02390 [Candidatus Paceibacterota bacterium]|nr:hypothetical protein [Candidatus Paceibacterota bacterium]